MQTRGVGVDQHFSAHGTETSFMLLYVRGDRVGRGRESEGSTEKDRRDRGPPAEQWKCWCGVPSPLSSDLCTAQLLCWTESLRQCPLRCCWRTTWTTRSKRRPTCSAQLHLPTHNLFWANVRVQLHLPPLGSLDLLISPGTLYRNLMMSWCLMSSDVIWHIRDKLWPMPKHGSIKSTYVRCMRV